MNIAQGEDVKEVSESIVKFIERRHGNAGEGKYRTYTAEGELETVNRIIGIIKAVVGGHRLAVLRRSRHIFWNLSCQQSIKAGPNRGLKI